jgi:hypothetical protein
MSTPISDLPFVPDMANSTQLQQRDVPKMTLEHTIDTETHINHVPEQPKYIEEQSVLPQTPISISLPMLDLARIPIIISLLYFVFQMHLVESLLLKVLPMLFKSDGSMTTTGIIIKSALFGGAYFAITQISEHVALV